MSPSGSATARFTTLQTFHGNPADGRCFAKPDLRPVARSGPAEPDPHHHRIGPGESPDSSPISRRPSSNGHAVRVPFAHNASLTDVGPWRLEQPQQVSCWPGECRFEAAANGPLQGILGYENPAPGVLRLRSMNPRSGPGIRFRRSLHPW